MSRLTYFLSCGLAFLALPVAPVRAEPPVEEKKLEWTSLFDGKRLGGWKATDFGGQGEVTVKDGSLVLAMGEPLTGVTWTREFPKTDYEISLEAMRVDGNDFFCGLTFPVGSDPCSLIVGGWAGSVVGLSSLDGADASENETTSIRGFKTGQWYVIRLRVTKDKIEAWIDKDQVVDVKTADKRISIRIEVEASKPLGISSFRTTATLKNIQFRRLAAK